MSASCRTPNWWTAYNSFIRDYLFSFILYLTHLHCKSMHIIAYDEPSMYVCFAICGSQTSTGCGRLRHVFYIQTSWYACVFGAACGVATLDYFFMHTFDFFVLLTSFFRRNSDASVYLEADHSCALRHKRKWVHRNRKMFDVLYDTSSGTT